jgi:acetyl esterase/lipase
MCAGIGDAAARTGAFNDGKIAMTFLGQSIHEIRSDVTYATHDGVELKGDLYLPSGPGPFPAIVSVHGGGWRAGARSTHQGWGRYFAERGHLSLAISYRLATQDRKTFPEAVHDVLAAVRYLRGNAAALKVDPERIALLGNSAGAHLAAMAALGGAAPALQGAYPQDAHAAISAKVKVLVAVYGIYDMVAQWQHSQVASPRENIVQMHLGKSPMEDRKLYFDASPISYTTLANNHIAAFLVWGTEDDLVNHHQQSETFLLALKQAQFFVRTCVVHGAPHYWMTDPIDEPGSYSGFVAPRLMRFLQERL